MTRHYRTLDGMRGVAALLVVAMHAHAFLSPIAAPHAYLAVDLFFALSGLVIAHAYGDRLSAGMGAGRFMLMRLVRLYPLYIAGTLVGIAYFAIMTRYGARTGIPARDVSMAIAAALLMLPSPVAIDPRHWLTPFNIAAWSLVFEMGANLLLVLLWRRLGAVSLTAIIVASAAMLVPLVLHHGNADLGAEAGTVLAGIPRTTTSFFLGIALYRIRPGGVRRTQWAWLLPAAIVPVAMAPATLGPWYDIGCIAIVFPAMILLGAKIEPVRTPAYAVLGLISYAVYALHGPMLPIAAGGLKLFGATPAQLAPWAGLLLLCGMAALAWLADLLYDVPVRRWAGSRLRTRQAAEPSPVRIAAS